MRDLMQVLDLPMNCRCLKLSKRYQGKQIIRSETERSKSFDIEFAADKVTVIKSVLNVFIVIITS
jgi:hypothetical protein